MSLNCLQSTVPTATPCGNCDACLTIAKGAALDVIEIDAASNTGVDNMRELIGQSQFQPMQFRYKVYVIDECHMLSTAAFNALLKTLEKPSDRVVFVLATTDPQRVLPTIISRCHRFDFQRIPAQAISSHLATIAANEGIEIRSDALRLIAQVAQGGLRDAQTLLDQLSLLDAEITPQHVWQVSGGLSEPDVLAVLTAILQPDANPTDPLRPVRRLCDRQSPVIVAEGILKGLTDLQQLQAGVTTRLYASLGSTVTALTALADQVDITELQTVSATVLQTITLMQQSSQPLLYLERCVLDLVASPVESD